jgi:hypothetical protein
MVSTTDGVHDQTRVAVPPCLVMEVCDRSIKNLMRERHYPHFLPKVPPPAPSRPFRPLPPPLAPSAPSRPLSASDWWRRWWWASRRWKRGQARSARS